MAYQIAPETQETFDFNDWFKNHFTNFEKELSDGPPIECVDINGRLLTAGINDTGILFSGCKLDEKDENLMSGNPVGFVHMSSVYSYVQANSREGILAEYEQPCFVLPLCQLDSSPALVDMMNEAYASFMFCTQGGFWQDNTYIAYGISTGLATLCRALCVEIDRSSIYKNAERLRFLVEALYCLALTARSTAKYSPQCHRIFTMMPYDATADSLQSTLLSFIFDESPCEAIRVNHLGSVILRDLNQNKSSLPYTIKPIIDHMCLLLVAPMLGGLLTMDLSTDDIIRQITKAYRKAIELIFNMIVTADKEQITLDCDIINKHVLCSFAMVTSVPFVRAELTDNIYNAVVFGFQDIISATGVPQHASFVNQVSGFTLNGELSRNSPVLMQIKNEHFASYTSTDPSNWTALTLRTGAQYTVKYTPLANLNHAVSDDYVSILRFTAGLEVMDGNYPWYSSIYDSSRSKHTNMSQIDHTDVFTVTSLKNGITVEHRGKIMLFIRNNDGRYLDPTLCFMNCTIAIELVQNFFQDQTVQGEPETMVEVDIPDNAIRSDSIRKATMGQHNWGQATVNMLTGTR